MLKARYNSPNGLYVTPEKFMALAGPDFRARGIFPYCPSCKERVDPYGVHSPNVRSRFDHQNLAEGVDPPDDCLEANRSDRFRGMHADDWDDERGIALREQFFETENLKQAYGFCLALCRKGNLSAVDFAALIRRADRKNIWAYKDIPLWIIPYVLLTLGNFGLTATTQYAFHFVLKKSKAKSLSELWAEPEKPFSLCKVFSNSGEEIRTSGNPWPISHQFIAETAGDTSWMHQKLIDAFGKAR